MQTIAVLITCFNRREKTLQCLQDIYNQADIDQYNIDIYIIDGGSSDGTQAAIQDQYPGVNIETIEGLYWAGGMRAAWAKASQQKDYDFYWLLNDDTHLFPNCLKELLKAHEYALAHYGKGGIYVGSTYDPVNKRISYGGGKLDRIGKMKGHRIIPNNHYQPCELGNANIMLVSKDVYKKIGILSPHYTHGIADYDYTLRAVKQHFPALVLPQYCGECVNDHGKNWVSGSVSLKKRIEYLYSPKGLAYHEYLFYIKEHFPKEYRSSQLKLWSKTFFPTIWTLFKK